ncbi:hypothetical protein [Vulgatibacter incomptus]|uniref:Outer membrane protein beta-barrel domain-containing protein n=1 Tax=Vulgatibacter incomptus TaxID=1391653 RepID=A0A0K1PDB5_9BACT|nr:hypothetical protein [Vulgatibacter incomptus]AKU91492.1 hypothetical protein AKJ08_1879 [Vulgatibacter incomptus]
MKFRSLLVASVFTLGAAFAAPAQAAPVRQPNAWGLGFMLGSPTGITAKHWLGGSDAIDIGVGAGPGFRVHADYLWGVAQLLNNTSDLHLDFYIGAGGLLGVARGWCSWYDDHHRRYRSFCNDGGFLGVRVPVGLDFVLRRAPISLGIEIAPGIVVSPHDADALVDAFFFARVKL